MPLASRVFDQLGEDARPLTEQGGEEISLAVEVPIDGPLAQVGLGGDVVERRPGVSLTAEDGERRGQNLAPGQRISLLRPRHSARPLVSILSSRYTNDT